jgi:hypothetical protein
MHLSAAIFAAGLMSKTGPYRPLHGIEFTFLALVVGLFSILNSHFSIAL